MQKYTSKTRMATPNSLQGWVNWVCPWEKAGKPETAKKNILHWTSSREVLFYHSWFRSVFLPSFFVCFPASWAPRPHIKRSQAHKALSDRHFYKIPSRPEDLKNDKCRKSTLALKLLNLVAVIWWRASRCFPVGGVSFETNLSGDWSD